MLEKCGNTAGWDARYSEGRGKSALMRIFPGESTEQDWIVRRSRRHRVRGTSHRAPAGTPAHPMLLFVGFDHPGGAAITAGACRYSM
jgi:hypothetical protein